MVVLIIGYALPNQADNFVNFSVMSFTENQLFSSFAVSDLQAISQSCSCVLMPKIKIKFLKRLYLPVAQFGQQEFHMLPQLQKQP